MHIALAGRMSDLQASDTLTMFHGTDETEAKKFLLSGIDGTKVVGRVHNQGHERGLYVTPSIKCARDFGSVVFEIRVRARDLYPTARWGFGVGRKTDVVKQMAADRYPNSFRPVVSLQLAEKREPQAMFLASSRSPTSWPSTTSMSDPASSRT